MHFMPGNQEIVSNLPLKGLCSRTAEGDREARFIEMASCNELHFSLSIILVLTVYWEEWRPLIFKPHFIG